MSRVHDALRKAGAAPEPSPASIEDIAASVPHDGTMYAPSEVDPIDTDISSGDMPHSFHGSNGSSSSNGLIRPDLKQLDVDWRTFLSRVKVIPFQPAPETHLIDVTRPHEIPAEEFRSLRTRLNHLQSQQDLHSVVVTSASPAEGKTFSAVNLALAEAQLELPVLLADLDLRRPVIHNLLQCDRSPGFSDYIVGDKPLDECIRRIEGSNLYFMPAGTQVKNPLELLNRRHVKQVLEGFRKVFNWIILDTPPLLFSADANLLSTLTDGTLMVVRIGSTTYDNVIRAMQSLCENNVLGIVANGARAGELYSKYTYYYSRTEDEE